jgi:predicted ABC-type exoprotein transport system permease subunit
MNFLIILYLFLQLAAAFFLYNELKEDLPTLISQGILMVITTTLYLAAHFKNVRPSYPARLR